MSLNDIALCSRALIRIGAAPITGFNDGTAEAEIAGALYEITRDALLSSYAWSFALGQSALTQLADAPEADYTYAYQLPAGFLRALSAGNGGRGRGLDFRIQNGALHVNSDAVMLTYLYAPQEETFPPYFSQALIARLSAEFCIPVTESTSRAKAHYAIAEDEFRRARQIDAQQDTPQRLEDFSLINARH